MTLSLQQIANALNGRIVGDKVRCPGPGHSREDMSLQVGIREGGADIFVHSFSPADDDMACLKWAREQLGIKSNGHSQPTTNQLADLMQSAVASQTRRTPARIAATYDYHDETGAMVYQVVRLEPKSFRQRQPDGNGDWIWRLDDVRRVPYRLPDIIKYPSATVIVCEGEKDADRVADLGLTATTVASGQWTDDCLTALAGRDVWILVDNDTAGEKKALEAASLLHAMAATVKLVRLPGLPAKGDVSDWLDMGHNVDDLVDACADTPDWVPPAGALGALGVCEAFGDPRCVDVCRDPKDCSVSPVRAPAINLVTPAPAPALPRLCFVKIEDWIDREPPERDWAVQGRFPLRNVSLISGEGSIGKSLALMQLTAGHILGRSWLDTLPEPGDAIYLNAEDESDELWRRYADIVRFHESPVSDLMGHLHLLAMAGQDAVLAHANHAGIVKPTPLLARLIEAAGDIKPKIIGLDTSADIFAGQENDRSQVRQFIGLLRGLAIVGNSSVMICTHPSLTGIASGSGLSGSTAWHNSVRARAYIHAVKVSDTEPDKTLRQIDFMKSNYSALADTITVRWKDGVYVMEAKPGSLEQLAADAKADQMFMAVLDKITVQGRTVSDKPSSPYYAPAVFALDKEAKAAGITRRMLAAAMQRLFEAQKIKVETFGKPSRQSTRIVAC